MKVASSTAGSKSGRNESLPMTETSMNLRNMEVRRVLKSEAEESLRSFAMQISGGEPHLFNGAAGPAVPPPCE